MTIRETIAARLVEKGLFPGQAAEIIEMAIRQVGEAIKWDDDISGYTSLLPVLWAATRMAAFTWFDEHCLEAWLPILLMEVEWNEAGHQRRIPSAAT